MEIEYSCPCCGKLLNESNVVAGICPFCHKLFEKPTTKNIPPQSVSVNKVTNESFNKVPEWHSYYSSVEDATEEQKRFIIYWIKEMRRGNAIDLQGNVSYVFAYLYIVIWIFIKTQNIENFTTKFRQIESFYGNLLVGKKGRVVNYLKTWEKDAYLLLKDYDSYWQCMQSIENHKLSVEEIINFRAKCKDTSLIASDVFKLLGDVSKLPKFAREHIDQVSQFLDDFLDDFHCMCNKNFVEYFCAQFDSTKLVEEDFLKLRELFPNDKQFMELKGLYQEQRSKNFFVSKSYLFSGVLPPLTVSEEFIEMPELNIGVTVGIKYRGGMPSIELTNIPYIISEALKNALKRKIKECKK